MKSTVLSVPASAVFFERETRGRERGRVEEEKKKNKEKKNRMKGDEEEEEAVERLKISQSTAPYPARLKMRPTRLRFDDFLTQASCC